MLNIFLVVYTATGGIASVSRPFSSPVADMEYCEEIAARMTKDQDAEHYVFECEQHKKPPKVTVKIDAATRETFELSCITRGYPTQCSDLPNGDVEFMTSARDRHGRRFHVITKPNGLSVTGIYDSKNNFHRVKEKD